MFCNFVARNAKTQKTSDTMLTIKQIRDDREAAIRKLAKKGVDAAPVIDQILSSVTQHVFADLPGDEEIIGISGIPQ